MEIAQIWLEIDHWNVTDNQLEHRIESTILHEIRQSLDEDIPEEEETVSFRG